MTLSDPRPAAPRSRRALLWRARFAALVAIVFAAPTLPAEPAAGSELDVAYVDEPHAEQRLDAYWPRAAPRSASVLFVHGGSLQEGGERRSSPMYATVCEPFVAAGMPCATMDYRLAPSFSWPAMPEDVASAVAWWRAAIARRGGDPGRLFVFGHSSGCHLAAIVATDPRHLARVGLTPRHLGGVVLMGCTLDREDAAMRRLTAEQIRVPFAAEPQDVATYGTAENWLAANPAGHLGAHVPPTLVVVARAERFMPPILEQGSRFVRRALELGIVADLVVVPGTHVSSVTNLRERDDPAFAAIRSFLEQPAAATSH
jgi:acetyl esterase/lipase